MSARRTKFYLDKRNAKLMGVCSGLSDYTGVNALLVRIGVVLLTIFALGPISIIAYLIVGFLADTKPGEFYDEDPGETKFWQGVRAAPGRSIRDVHARFRDIDRRLADVESHVTSSNSRLAREIEALR